MQIEKKLILCSILAISIGIAAIVPIGFIMAAQAQINYDQAEAIVSDVAPLSNGVNITYAYINPNKVGIGNTTTPMYGANIEIVANFTLNPEALNGADAQIEYYKFAVSTEQGPVINMGYYIALESGSSFVTGIGGPLGTINFANGLTLNGPTNGENINYGCGGQALNMEVYTYNFANGLISRYIYGTDPDNPPQEVSQLVNAQKITIDVTKVCSVTVKGDITVTTPGSDEILQHIEISRSDNSAFVYGAFANTLPFPIDGPTSVPLTFLPTAEP